MLGNAKALKRNNEEREGILIGPSFFFEPVKFRPGVFSPTALAMKSASAQVSRHGWQVDADNLSACRGQI